MAVNYEERINRQVVNYNKVENFIRVGNKANELADFPTPSSIAYSLADVDKDPFTDLKGYTHRNRVRNNVLSLQLGYNMLSDNDLSTILKKINKQWIYVELTDKRTKERTVYKMYASDKEFNTFIVWQDEQGNWHEEYNQFSVTLVQE